MAKRSYPRAYYTLGPMAQAVWRQPWRYKLLARINPVMRRKLRRALDSAGLITPHFRWADAACKDGTPVPAKLRRNAIKHAWKLERMRHALGDRPLPVMSWYRHPAYNRKIGGAVKSQHINALATDFDKAVIDSFGRARFFAAAEKIFKNDGVGSYASGSGHTDSRGFWARWSAFVGQ